MVDKIKLIIKDNELNTSNLLTKLLNSKKTTVTQQTETGFKAKFSNFFVTLRNNKLYVEGSLTKFGYGYNSHNADKITTNHFISGLLQELGLSPSTQIHQLEVGFNIAVRHKALAYINVIQSAKGYNKVLRYTNKQVVFIKSASNLRIYDKTNHFVASLTDNTGIPADLNIIRYEILLANPAEFFQLPAFTFAHLECSKTQNLLITKWADEFNKVIFKPLVLPAKQFTSPHKFYEHLQLMGIEAHGGMENVFSIIDATMEKRLYMYRKRAKDKIRSLYCVPELATHSELGFELREKVQFAASYYKAQLI